VVAQSSPPGPAYPPPPAGGLPPTIAATPPGSTPPAPPYTPASPYGSGFNNDVPPAPFTGYGNDMAPPPPAPTPTDPYAVGGVGSFQFQPPRKKTSPWLIIGIVVIALVVVVGGSGLAIALASHSGGGGGGGGGGGLLGSRSGNTSPSMTLNNLAITYANDDITFKSVQQAQTFPDDDLANSNFLHKYFVRVNIHESNTTADNSDVFYDEAFHLILPDGTTVNALNSQQDTGPQNGEKRDNWLDFGTNGKVDLSKLTLVIGQSDEQQMKVPLQSGANLSAYQPKTINPNQHFQYADMDWVLKDATQSLSFGGEQAKKGKVYVVVDMIVNNNSQGEFTSDGYSFVNLHSGSTSTAPDALDLTASENFIDIQPGDTNVTGTWEFDTPPSPNGQYTLAFAALPNSDIPVAAQNVNFTIN
jgi:hypothetical protein